MMPSKPVCCWKKHKKKAIQVEDAYFRSQQAWPRVTPLAALSDLLLRLSRMSAGLCSESYTFAIKLSASASFPFEIEKPMDSSGNIVKSMMRLSAWQIYGKP